MARDQIGGASAQAAVPPIAPPSGPPASAQAPVEVSPLVEVRFLRRWRSYNTGDRANFLGSMANQLITVGYGEAVNASRLPMVRK